VIETSGQAVMPQARRERQHWRFGPHNTRMKFRRWRRSRPFWGGLWAILGGAICALGPASAIKLLIAAGTTVWLGVLVGVLISIFGLFLWFSPQQRHLFGVLIAVLSVVSLITSDFGGFLIGMLLGITGGAMGFAWVPTEPKVRKHRLFRRHAAVGAPADAVIPVVGTVPVATGVEKTGEEVERTPVAEPEAVTEKP
jgi:hypothetical protein